MSARLLRWQDGQTDGSRTDGVSRTANWRQCELGRHRRSDVRNTRWNDLRRGLRPEEDLVQLVSSKRPAEVVTPMQELSALGFHHDGLHGRGVTRRGTI